MNKRDLDCLQRSADIIRRLNTNDSQWLNETADSVENIAKSAEVLERVRKRQNRVEMAKDVPSQQVPVLTAAVPQRCNHTNTHATLDGVNGKAIEVCDDCHITLGRLYG